jgi:hypothetical protein
MIDPITLARRLAKFPEPSTPEEILCFSVWMQQLRRANNDGYLIHGGPGSGKTRLLRTVAEVLNTEPDVLTIGPIDMGLWRGQPHADIVLRDLVSTLFTTAHSRIPQIPQLGQPLRDLFTEGVLARVAEILEVLMNHGVRRTILLLDDFDHTHPLAALSLASHLRRIYDTHKACFDFVLSTESDLAELYRQEHLISPLRNVTDSRLLLDLTSVEARRYARERAQTKFQLTLSEEELEQLDDETGGYPALLNSLVALLAAGRQTDPSYSVMRAIHELCDSFYDHEPLRTVAREIEDLASLSEGHNPVKVLRDLAANDNNDNLPDPADRGARLLLAMGTLRWYGRTRLTWRNPIVKQFWESGTGRKLLQRPFSYVEGVLSAQGSVLICLLLDLGPLLEDSEAFNARRGSSEWLNHLRSLKNNFPQGGPFHPWSQQNDLTNLGHDLNLFRTQIIQNSFTPIYEANADKLDLSFKKRLDRLAAHLPVEKRAEIRTVLQQEWAHWDQVRLQLTRDGSVSITLIRDIRDARPLMRILDDLLGLERELPDEGRVELSVQWELALAIVDRFLEQIGPCLPQLGLRWRGAVIEPETPLYPDRDRYMIYQFHELCNCRPGRLLPEPQRRLIKVSDLEPLRTLERQDTPQWQVAYSYGRELAALMEGVMVALPTSDNDTGHFPSIKSHEVTELLHGDLSSWDNELFTISLDNALILYSATEKIPSTHNDGNEETPTQKADSFCRACHDYHRQKIRQLYFPQRPVPYEDYWRCITLGLQYLLQLRWVAKWVARRTTEDLATVANLMSQEFADRDRSEMNRLTSGLALNTRLVSRLREAAIPLSIATADYAVNKYETFIEISHLRRIIANAEKDIEAIDTFLRRDEDQREEEASTMANWRFAAMGAFLAWLAMIVTCPSVWVDFENSVLGRSIWPQSTQPPPPPGGMLIAAFMTIAVVVVFTLLGSILLIKALPQRKRRKKRRARSIN